VRSPAVALELRRAVLLALVMSAATLVAVSGVPRPAPGPDGAPTADPVALEEGGPSVRPYVARRQTFGRARSPHPIDVAFDRPPERVWRWFVDREREGHDAPAAVFGPDRWRPTTGADRYADVIGPGDDRPEWQPTAYQLYHGAYFGEQYHLRVFDASSGDREWTVVQARAEHWDWFAITHRVDSVERP